MINYSGFRLENGLQVYVHEDHSTPMAVVNITYHVGSRNESEKLTGFAHLFEHLMFGGSANIPSFDHHVQEVGGECNAFTSPDITNYYITLPSDNLETAFWLESDRMSRLSINASSLEIQRKVVTEEYKQRYLNQPYGDMWLETLPLAYRVHPYRWATIGRDISHIENAALDDVRSFYANYYVPSNAVMVVAGNVSPLNVRKLTEKWFGEIEAGDFVRMALPEEPPQEAPREKRIEAEVPLSAITRTYHMPGRFDDGFFETDLLCDILGKGKSSRLYNSLVKDDPVFSRISAKTTSALDPGLVVIKGFLNTGQDPDEADHKIEQAIALFAEHGPTDEEVMRVKNQSEAAFEFAEVELLNRAMNLGYAATAGNPDWVNQDILRVKEVTREGIQKAAQNILNPHKRSTLYYLSKSEK